MVTAVKPATSILRMEEMRAELKRQVAELGVNEFCRQRGIEHHASVSLALSGKRPVTETIANACGYLAQTVFVPMGDTNV